ncbi:DUF5810 domain-containing protein [Halegenticoccus tardaugens]|uniref:DUF5810 domain-containing protein n=1 Tax=Halegenticoccus tardaugens TaxID=2071624 RepID=UPI00100A2DCE|nr:DUF5810 domain-containing protein [Halegenticoccus tardaugens]
MGYACPVCDTPQRDGRHLADHLAFTALLRGGDHESWLDEHVPEWEGSTPSELAAEATTLADEAAYAEVFEDTVEGHGHDRAHVGRGGVDAVSGEGAFAPPASRGPSPADAETRRVLAEAEELTRRMFEDDGGDPEEGGERNGDEAGGDDPSAGDPVEGKES